MNMLARHPLGRLLTNAGTTILLVAAILVGALIGSISESTGADLGSGVDRTVILLVSLVFFEANLATLRHARGNLRFIAVAWVTNFVVIPSIGFLVASIVLAGKPLFFTGLVIYFMAPCTDWFLGFTRLAKGNTSLGAALIPINMVTQLLLYPVYLRIFTEWQTGVDVGGVRDTLIDWFLVPFVIAAVAHVVLERVLPARIFATIMEVTTRLIPLVIALLVLEIFAANVGTIRAHVGIFALILLGVFVFFLLTYALGERISRLFDFAYPEHALLTMTTAARNAPLMLGVTVAAIPDQPLVYAALIIGMLVEFPHLTVLTQILRRQRAATELPPPTALSGRPDAPHAPIPATNSHA